MNPKILIVDDNKANRELLKLIIKKLNCEIIEAKDGEEGIVLAQQQIPDLIFMDIQLPGLDGIKAYEIIKSNKNLQNTPIIAFTSYAMKGDKEKLLKMGFVDYISKPIDIAEIEKLLKKFFPDIN